MWRRNSVPRNVNWTLGGSSEKNPLMRREAEETENQKIPCGYLFLRGNIAKSKPGEQRGKELRGAKKPWAQNIKGRPTKREPA